MENKERNVFVSILSAFINKKDISVNDDVDLNKIYTLAKIHDVISIVEYKVNSEKYKKSPYFLAYVMNSLKKENAVNEIFKAFNENKLYHIIIKGHVLRDYYPVKELRTMGDADILVESSDINKANSIMLKLGYKKNEVRFGQWSYNKDSISIELHESLVHEEMWNSFDYGQYFKSAFDNTVVRNGYTLELKKEYHFIFMIYHIAKHFESEGCGIRMIMDIAVFVKYFENKIDWEYIFKELYNIKLKKFAENIFYICKVWFDTSFPFKLRQIDENLFYEVSDYILSGGTFGFVNRSSGNKVIRQGYANNNGNIETGRLKSMIQWIFPNDFKMRQLNLWYKDKSIVFLPVAWINRLILTLIKKRKSVVLKAIGVITQKDEAIKEYNLLYELGLYEKKL